MINELKELLKDVTVTVTKTRGKQEITFSFKEVEEISTENLEAAVELHDKIAKEARQAKKDPIEVKVSKPADVKGIPTHNVVETKVVSMVGNSESKVEAQADIMSQIEEVELEERAIKANAADSMTDEEAEQLGKETREEIKAELKTESLLTEAIKNEVRTPEQLERVSKLSSLGFIEKVEENQFVRGGIGIGTVMILSCDASTFNNHYLNIKEDIDKSNAMKEKPKSTFSDFKAEQVSFPEPVILGASSQEEADEVLKNLQDAGLAPKTNAPVVSGLNVPKAVPPIPKAKKTLDEMYEELKAKFAKAGYDVSAMVPKDYPNEDAIKQMDDYLRDNPVN